MLDALRAKDTSGCDIRTIREKTHLRKAQTILHNVPAKHADSLRWPGGESLSIGNNRAGVATDHVIEGRNASQGVADKK